jgi:predicted NUDIX family phosphoesterase
MKDRPMSTVQTERVLVVPTALFHELGHFQGFSSDVDRYLKRLFSPTHMSYRPRGEMERDPRFKQLIPYVIFCYESAAGVAVFQYTRGTGQGEGRLHRKRSIGIGGHISAIDAGGPGDANPYREGMRRELEEEVAIDTPYCDRCVGLINDDLSEVGQVHLGIVHRCDVERPAVSPRESDLVDSGFRPVAELLRDVESFETWSQICLKSLFGGSNTDYTPT